VPRPVCSRLRIITHNAVRVVADVRAVFEEVEALWLSHGDASDIDWAQVHHRVEELGVLLEQDAPSDYGGEAKQQVLPVQRSQRIMRVVGFKPNR